MSEFIDKDIKFVDRDTEFPNRKILEVKRVDRDEAGELKSMCVEEIRDEGKITEEGTPLNAESMNNVIDSINESINNIYTTLENINSNYTTLDNDLKNMKASFETKARYYIDLDKIEQDFKQISLNDTANEDFTLQTIGTNVSSIVWSSSTPSVISIDGNIARVTKPIVPTTVTLTAHAVYQSATLDKEYYISVDAREATDSEKVNYDINGIHIPNLVFTTFELPIEGYFGSSIQWSSNDSLISIKGNVASVVQDYIDKNVVLNARVSIGEEVAEKQFVVTVQGAIGYASEDLVCIWMQRRGILQSKSYTITSTSNMLFNIEIEVDNNYISAVIDQKVGKQVRFTIKETDAANQSVGSGVLSFPYNIHFLNENGDVIATVPGMVRYYQSSTTPAD